MASIRRTFRHRAIVVVVLWLEALGSLVSLNDDPWIVYTCFLCPSASLRRTPSLSKARHLSVGALTCRRRMLPAFFVTLLSTTQPPKLFVLLFIMLGRSCFSNERFHHILPC